ncbi:DMT family transporter [Oceaniradius stylonematis]|uniref:DMT family transporter n=1 Tax=Oceaniradius stylonematis TaxID=2184161 RepID=UPI00273D70EA|nr:DMT family transporter [Oceaniradius stylonematis]
MPLSANIRGCLFMSLSMAAFTINDTLTKSVMDTLNTGQIMFVRGAVILAGLLVYLRVLRRPILAKGMFSAPVIVRTGGELAMTVLFLGALAHLPLANATAVLQAVPLAVALGAALYLGERVGWRRWTAILIGFCGVLLIVRPGLAGFNAYTLMVVGAVIFAAVRDLATHRIVATVPSLTISALTALTVTLTGLVLIVPLGGWTPMDASVVVILMAAAGFLFAGYLFIVMAMREGDIGFVAPFRYTALLWALILGLAFFGEFPDTATLAGAAIVVGTGIYTLYRESRPGRARHAARRPAAASRPAPGA